MAQDFTWTSPSLPTSPTPSRTPPFYVPGPSSRFNTKHERSRSQYTFQRSYTPTAPHLSTAQRAHRRAHTSANVPTLKRMYSSPPNERANAPRPPMSTLESRFYSYSPNRMPSTMYNGHTPITPAAKRSHSDSRPNSKLQDSPFSDYFTDDGQSNSNDVSYRAPSAETQQLLVRLNKLQAQLMRSTPDDVLSEHEKAVIVGRKVGEIETQFHALNSQHSQTRLPPDLEDSGLFMDEETENSDETPDAQIHSFESAAKAFIASEIEGEDMKTKHDTLLQDAQKVLENVNKANERLRQLYAETRENHKNCASQIDALELENAKLRSKTTTLEFDADALQSANETLKTENDSLKTDLSFNRAELLYLRLRHRALEVEIEALHNGAHRLESYAPEMREEIQQIKRARIRERMGAWEDSWVGIDQRMRQRRSKHGAEPEVEVESLEEILQLGHADVDGVEITRFTQTKGTQMSVLGEDSAVGIEDTPSPKPAESVEEEYSGIVQVNKSTQTDAQLEEPMQPQEIKSIYANQITQTTPLPSPATSSWVLAGGDEDDCAITTSSEDNGDGSFSEFSTDDAGDAKTPTSDVRAAWQDLWDGLTNLAGMGEGY